MLVRIEKWGQVQICQISDTLGTHGTDVWHPIIKLPPKEKEKSWSIQVMVRDEVTNNFICWGGGGDQKVSTHWSRHKGLEDLSKDNAKGWRERYNSTDSKDIFLTFAMKEKKHYNLIHIICLILNVCFKGYFNYLIRHESGYWSSNFMVLWCLSCWTQ